jgi:hypothetical protein
MKWDDSVEFEPGYWRVVQEQLQRLRSAGLAVSDAVRRYGDNDFGFVICKPKSTPGNSFPIKEVWLGETLSDKRAMDAPALMLETDNGRWVLGYHMWTPGPGPGDFRHVYDRLDEAIGDVLDFYFGDPERVRRIWRNSGMG